MSNPQEVPLEDAHKVAEKLLAQGNWTLAERTFRDILQAVPDDFKSHHFIGILSYQSGRMNESLSFLQKAVQINDNSPDTWNAYGAVLGALNRQGEAVEKFEKAIEKKKNYPEAYSNMSHALWQQGKYKEAEEAARKATELKPDFADGYLNLGGALSAQGKQEEAIKMWEKTLEFNPKHPNAFSNIGNAYRELGQIKKSEEMCRKAVEIAPENAHAHMNLGNALRDQRRSDEAETHYRKAIELYPQYVDAHNNLAVALIDQYRYGDAAGAARFALAFDANNFRAHSNLSIALRETGQLEEAERVARQLLNINPNSAEAKIDLADILFLMDRFSESETLLTDAMEKAPENARLLMKMSYIFEKTGRITEALEAVDKAVQKNPESPEVYHRQAQIYFIDNRIEQAMKSLDKALELKPGFTYALNTKSELQQSHGDMEGARETIEKALEDKNDNHVPFYFTLSKVKKFTKDDPMIPEMEELAKQTQLHGMGQVTSLHFALFKAYEDIGEYDKAFAHLKKGNDMKRKNVVFDRMAQRNYFEKVKHTFTKEYIESFQGKGYESEAPVFIVGMPRSGTTLTEQIISSHPKVFGAGELYTLAMVEKDLGQINHENAYEHGKEYVERVRAITDEAQSAEKLTDKMPGNFLRMGQIVAALPNAKIIHCRRNPVDTCLSCYKQLFSRGHYWTYSFDEMAEYYTLYSDMMDHWRRIMPDKFIEIYYEDTVNDFENQARKLIDYVELEWDDKCLTPHKTKRSILTASKGQVRKPIYKSSVEAWRRYEDQLAPLAEALEPFKRKKKA
jgi:tetratricopeptide (TPR) repeat protein